MLVIVFIIEITVYHSSTFTDFDRPCLIVVLSGLFLSAEFCNSIIILISFKLLFQYHQKALRSIYTIQEQTRVSKGGQILFPNVKS